jgi:hypothetical protein
MWRSSRLSICLDTFTWSVSDSSTAAQPVVGEVAVEVRGREHDARCAEPGHMSSRPSPSCAILPFQDCRRTECPEPKLQSPPCAGALPGAFHLRGVIAALLGPASDGSVLGRVMVANSRMGLLRTGPRGDSLSTSTSSRSSAQPSSFSRG